MNSKIVKIALQTNSYNIVINDKKFDFDAISDQLSDRKIAIVTNEIVAPLYLQTLKDELENHNSQLYICQLKDGERFKNMDSWSYILSFLADHEFNRTDLLISLGGGVICDITGYAAASWMRGIDFIQVPTTLLAQVDASVGGKTGINHKAGKNLIGAFHQPKAVIINTSTIQTLPIREFKSGLGEVIKYGLINQPDFISWLRNNKTEINNQNMAVLTETIAQCCQFKADIVQQDEKENGIRALLNLGHTFAHAIETHTQYQQYTHGEAVAIGMLMAAQLSVIIKIAQPEVVSIVNQLLSDFELQTVLPDTIDAEDLVELMRLDKKAQNKVHRLILLKNAGSAFIQTGVCEEDILKSIKSCQE